jgi:transposase InsO family protein
MENSLHLTYSDISLYKITSRITNSKLLSPQMQGKIEAYNKIVKNEFLGLENIPNMDDVKLRYDMFVKAYNETREHGGINGLTPSQRCFYKG